MHYFHVSNNTVLLWMDLMLHEKNKSETACPSTVSPHSTLKEFWFQGVLLRTVPSMDREVEFCLKRHFLDHLSLDSDRERYHIHQKLPNVLFGQTQNGMPLMLWS